MKFCPKCGAIVLPKKDGKKVFLACNCGWTDKRTNVSDMSIKEEMKHDGKDIEVIDGDEEALPKTEKDCQKCENKEAYYWFIQTRAGDEPETRFYRCTECKHTWREYS